MKHRKTQDRKITLKEWCDIYHSSLLKDWDYEKNDINPEVIAYNSNKYVFWKCNNCKYEWKTKLSNRVNGRGCPVCNNKKVVKGINDLGTTHPKLAKEWHPTKNGELKPNMVTYGCGKKVYWLCPKGHEYQATINHRSGKGVGTNCPICNSGRQTSFAEQAVFYYVKKEYPDAINRYKPEFLGKMEIDIFIPSINVAIEYDGALWHKKDRRTKENKKYKLCKENRIKLIRICESMPELGSEIADMCLSYGSKTYEPKYLNEVIKDLIFHLNFRNRKKLNINVDRDEHKILKYIQLEEKNNLESLYPDLAKEWHPTKNKDLKPNMFKPHSDHKVWWLCSKCGNEYYAAIGHRSYGTGCPRCGITKNTKKRSIPVEMLDPTTGKVIKEFGSISEAARKMKSTCSNIAMACKKDSKRPNAAGYKWRKKKN